MSKMTDGERRAYGRGYNTGRLNSWPAHMPPIPPNPLIARLLGVLEDICNEVDGACAMLDEDDELVVALGPKLDAGRAALAEVTEWLRTGETPSVS